MSDIKFDLRDARPKPALEKWLNVFYDALEADARKQRIDGKTHTIYEGFFSKLFKTVVGNPRYYTPIRQILTSGDDPSITILRRGNPFEPTVCVLNHKPPAQENWPEHLTKTAMSATMKAEFERRLAALESWREITGGVNILEALRDFEVRLAKLEKTLGNVPSEAQKRKARS